MIVSDFIKETLDYMDKIERDTDVDSYKLEIVAIKSYLTLMKAYHEVKESIEK